MLTLVKHFIFIAMLSVLAGANAATTATTSEAASDLSLAQSAAQLERLQTAGQQLETALINLLQQSNQLQASLSALNRQIEHSKTLKQQENTPENAQQVQQLHQEYEEAENALLALRQQEVQLQKHLVNVTQQLMQLPEKIRSASPTTKPTSQQQSMPAANANTAPTTAVPQPQSLNSDATEPKNVAPLTSPAATAPSASSTTDTAAATAPTTTAVTSHSNHLEEPSPVSHINEKKPAAKTTILAWLQDPAIMLRIGGGFIAIALLLIIILIWPKSKKPKTATITSKQERIESIAPTSATTAEELADLEAEYDFMNTEAAIPTRLNLAKGYLAMGRYGEAREAIKPIFEKGSTAQKQEANTLLQEIQDAEQA